MQQECKSLESLLELLHQMWPKPLPPLFCCLAMKAEGFQVIWSGAARNLHSWCRITHTVGAASPTTALPHHPPLRCSLQLSPCAPEPRTANAARWPQCVWGVGRARCSV